jgi:hypothetical protein
MTRIVLLFKKKLEMELSGNTVLPTIADSLLSSEGFRNAVCLFINKQQAKIRAKEEAEEDFRKLSDAQKESIREALPRQESTVVKLIKAALVRLSEYNQEYFDSEEQLSKANQNKEYYDIPLRVLMTLPGTHPIIQRKNNHYNNRIANTIYGCRRISSIYVQARPRKGAGAAAERSAHDDPRSRL